MGNYFSYHRPIGPYLARRAHFEAASIFHMSKNEQHQTDKNNIYNESGRPDVAGRLEQFHAGKASEHWDKAKQASDLSQVAPREYLPKDKSNIRNLRIKTEPPDTGWPIDRFGLN